MVENVSAVGGNEPKKQVLPGLISEYKVKQAINADPTQKPENGETVEYTKEQAEALLNDPYYKGMQLELTTFDEKTFNSKLNAAKTSIDVFKLEIAKTEKQRQLLEVEFPALPIEDAKGWFDGSKAIPGTEAYAKLARLIHEVGASNEQVNDLVGKRYYTETHNQMIQAASKVDESILFRMINKSDYDDAQKEKLKEGLENAYSKDMNALAAEFGIKVDASGLENLKPDGTREDAEAQLAILNKMLEDMAPLNNINDRIKELKDNIEAHVGKTPVDNSRVGTLVQNKVKEQQIDEIERDKKSEKNLKKTLKELEKLQSADIEAYITMKKLELLKASMGEVKAQIEKLQKKLDLGVETLIKEEKAEGVANKKRNAFLKTEAKTYKQQLQNVRKKRVKSEKAAVNVAKAEKHDSKKNVYTEDVEKSTKTNVDAKQTERVNALNAEDKAVFDKKKIGFQKNSSHIYAYIDNLFENKKIDKQQSDALKEALDKYKEPTQAKQAKGAINYSAFDADKLEIIADWIKFDDQSDVAIRKKAKGKISTETNVGGIEADKLLFLLQTVKDMELELETGKQKVAAKEMITDLMNKRDAEAEKKDEEVK